MWMRVRVVGEIGIDGTCIGHEWRIYSGGTLTIEPAVRAMEGVLITAPELGDMC